MTSDNFNPNDSAPKFRARGEDGFVEMSPGILRRTLLWGEHTQLAEFRLAAGARIQTHDHPQEQIGFMISGRLKFVFENAERVVGPGDSWVFPGGLPHAADIIEDCVVIEAFSPPRECFM